MVLCIFINFNFQGPNRLFHRAILSSGSSFSQSALVNDPDEVWFAFLVVFNFYTWSHLLLHILLEFFLGLNIITKHRNVKSLLDFYWSMTVWIGQKPYKICDKMSPRVDLKRKTELSMPHNQVMKQVSVQTNCHKTYNLAQCLRDQDVNKLLDVTINRSEYVH